MIGKTKNRTRFLIFSLIYIAFIICTVLTLGIGNRHIEAYQLRVDELFESSMDVSSKMNQSAVVGGMTGIKFQTAKDNASINLKDTMCGKFSILMQPYSDNTGVKSFSSITLNINSEDGSNLLKFVVQNMNADWSKVFIQKDNVVISDEIGLLLPFSNARDNKVGIFFDPMTGQAGIESDKKIMFNVNLTEIADIQNYKVSIQFGGVKLESNILVYSLNEQLLSGSYLQDGAAPMIAYSQIRENAIVGEPMNLPSINAYDVVSKDSVTKSVSVMLPSGAIVKLENNAKTFTPTQIGKHYFIINALDKTGKSRNVSVEFLAREVYDIEIVLKAKLSDVITVGAGSIVKFPSAFAKTDYIVSGFTKQVTLEVGGKSYDATAAQAIKFETVGTYTAKYLVELNNKIKTEKTITVEVIAIPYLNADIKTEYFRGEMFEIPTVSAAMGGTTYAAKPTLISPSGEIVDSGLVLNTIGEYRLIYTFEYDGEEFQREYNFSVTTSAESLITDTKDLEYNTNSDAPYYAARENGIMLKSTTQNAQFYYDSEINFTRLKRNGTPLVEFMFAPEVQGEPDIEALEFIFTDVDDPTNTFRIYLRDDGTRDYYYLCNAYAAAGNNSLIGNYWDRQYNPVTAKGSQPHISLRGVGYENKLMNTGKIWFDYSDMSVWGNYLSGDMNILRLSNATHVGAGNEWHGFVNGRAKMSVKIYGKGSMMLMSVAGQKLSGDIQNSVNDAEIIVDYDSSNVPQGVVGVKYKIFDVHLKSSFDGNNYNYSLNAYKNYGANDQTPVAIVDGGFTPDSVGKYTLVYSANKIDGSKLETVISVDVKSAVDMPTVVFTEDEENIFKGGMNLGTTQNFPKGRVTGGSGSSEVKVAYKKGQEAWQNYEGEFTPTSAGLYTIKYSITDYLGREASVERTIDVTASDKFIYTEAVMPINNGAIISGKTYILPEISAYKFSSDGNSQACSSVITYTYNGKTENVGTDRKITPNVLKSGDKITVTYTPSMEGDASSYELSVIKASDKVFEFFYGENITAAPADKFTTYSFTGNSTLKFVNVLPSYDFTFKYRINSSNNGLKGIKFTFTDAENSDIAFEVTFLKSSNGTTDIYLNGKFSRNNKTVFVGEDWSISYNRATKGLVKGKGTPILTITDILNGEKFEGFESERFFMQMDMISDGAASIDILGICGHIVDGIAGDYNQPTILYELTRTAEFGDKYVLPKMVAVDILDPNVVATVSIRTPRKSYILKNVDAFSSHTVTLSEYGNYTVEISVKDGNFNELKRSIALSVRDQEAPKLQISGTVPSSGSMGKEISLPSSSAIDNVDKNLTVYIFVYDPSGMTVSVQDGKFTPSVNGTYHVVYFVQDSFYNYDKETFDIVVK